MNHETIDSYLEGIEKKKAAAMDYNAYALRAQIACDETNDDEGDPGIGAERYRDRWTVGYSDGSGGTLEGLIVSRQGATDAKQAVPMLRRLAKAGYTIKKREDYADLGRLAWRLERKRMDGEKSVCPVIHLQLYLPRNDPDAVCSWVKVGEKTEDVMELQCGGLAVSAEGEV